MGETSEREICGLTVRVLEFAVAERGGKPLRDEEGLWRYGFTDANGVEWEIEANGHREPIASSITPGTEVAPFNVIVYGNGWPFAVLDPFGGTVGFGEVLNEDAFVAALDAEQSKFGAAPSTGGTTPP